MRNVLAPALVLLLLPRRSPWRTTPLRSSTSRRCAPSPSKPLSLCAAISDDGNVAVARLYFRRAGEDFYAFVQHGLHRRQLLRHAARRRARRRRRSSTTCRRWTTTTSRTRTSTFRLPVQPEGVCEFSPVEKDAAKAAAIKVYATNRKQGKKLDDGFARTGVTFVPLP